MVRNTVCLKVDPEDRDKMMRECKELFLKHNPKMEGMHLTQKFMFKKVVKFYLDED